MTTRKFCRSRKLILSGLRLDDPEQPIPKPARQGYLVFMLPAPAGSSWLTVYRNLKDGEVGVTLSSSRDSAGEYAMETIASDWEAVSAALGGGARLVVMKDARQHPQDSFKAGPLDHPDRRKEAFAWLAERVNAFVNVMRPRVRSAVIDYRARRGE